MPDIQELFAQNLRVLRKSKELSQMQLAELCDLSTKYIQEMEGARRYPGPKNLEVIAEVLGVQPCELIMDPAAKVIGFGKEQALLWVLDQLEDRLLRLVRKEIQELRESLRVE
jgi:transcriptional regulator with XRE-family HTH domain